MSNIEGEVELKIYYELEGKIGLNIKEVTIPFITKVQASNDFNSIIDNIEFDLNEGTVIIKCIVYIEENNLQGNKIDVVQNVIKKELVNNENDYSMIVYNIKPNDTLWDIAKKFRVKQENIINYNELEEPYTLKFGEKMYIIR